MRIGSRQSSGFLSWTIEKRLDAPRRLQFAIPAFSIVAALATGAAFLALMGVSPFEAYSAMFRAAWMNPPGPPFSA